MIGKECRHIEFFSKNLMETGGMPKTNARTPTTEVLPLRTRGRAYGRRNLRTTWRGWRRGAMQDIPRDPHIKYRDDGWISMLDWLGYTGRGPHDSMREMLPFADARAIVRSAKEWWAWCKSGQRPYNISHSTHIRFIPYPDWLGYKSLREGWGKMRSFAVARAVVRKLELRSS